MKVYPLLAGWCAFVLLCWFAALAAALLYTTGAWLARGRGACRRVL